MADVLRQASIACLPSYREGLPKFLLEAAATGLPIVTTDVPGCREVVTNELNGLLVPARGIQGVGRCARAARLRHPRQRARFGEAGRRRCEDEFAVARVIGGHASDLRRVRSRPPCGASLIMRVLVTGATGFVGRHLVDRLLREDVHVRAAVRGGDAAIPNNVRSRVRRRLRDRSRL